MHKTHIMNQHEGPSQRNPLFDINIKHRKIGLNSFENILQIINNEQM